MSAVDGRDVLPPLSGVVEPLSLGPVVRVLLRTLEKGDDGLPNGRALEDSDFNPSCHRSVYMRVDPPKLNTAPS